MRFNGHLIGYTDEGFKSKEATMKVQAKTTREVIPTFTAHQFNAEQPVSEWPQWLLEAWNKTQGTCGSLYEYGTRYWINELSRDQCVNTGDWILTNADSSDLDVVCDAAFRSAFEPADATLEARVAKLEEFVGTISEELSDPKPLS